MPYEEIEEAGTPPEEDPPAEAWPVGAPAQSEPQQSVWSAAWLHA